MPDPDVVTSDRPLEADSLRYVPRRRKTDEERLKLSRERNRVHARKTRERKKNQTSALQTRVQELLMESEALRQLIDVRYTASGLLGLNSGAAETSGSKVPVLSSAQICGNYYLQVLTDHPWMREGGGLPCIDLNLSVSPKSARRARRGESCTPQEREVLRRERNRIHAKKARERKKLYIETSKKMVHGMELEAIMLKEYLVKIGLLSEEALLEHRRRAEALALEQVDDGSQRVGDYENDDDRTTSSDGDDCDVTVEAQDCCNDGSSSTSLHSSHNGLYSLSSSSQGSLALSALERQEYSVSAPSLRVKTESVCSNEAEASSNALCSLVSAVEQRCELSNGTATPNL